MKQKEKNNCQCSLPFIIYQGTLRIIIHNDEAQAQGPYSCQDQTENTKKHKGQNCHSTRNKTCHLILAQFSFIFFNFNSKVILGISKLGLKIRIQKIKQGSNPSFPAKQNNNLTEHNGLSLSLFRFWNSNCPNGFSH